MKSGQTTDELLVRRFNAGEAKAMDEIYNMYFKHLYYFAWRIIQNAPEAEDIAVVTLEILLRRSADFVTMANIKAFLYITVRNKCLKYLEANKRHRASEKELGALQDESDDYILAQMTRSELMMEIYREIENLAPVRKNVFKMFYIDDLDSQEIAQLLGISLDSVYNNKLKALKQLRNVLFDRKLMSLLAGLLSVRNMRL